LDITAFSPAPELEIVESISHETVRQTLKKKLNLAQGIWVIPPEEDAEFVYHMEDVIDVYTRLYDLCTQVCFDESNKQLVGETVEPLPLEPGQPQRYDYQYERNGCVICSCSLNL